MALVAWLLAAALVVFAGAHVALVVGLGRARSWKAAVVALLLPPLAPWWGYRAGLRVATIAWCAALAVYTLGVLVA
ncbi:MAG TPA: hypothetical protein VIY73_20420 [Polyangiaceae bacterium]